MKQQGNYLLMLSTKTYPMSKNKRNKEQSNHTSQKRAKKEEVKKKKNEKNEFEVSSDEDARQRLDNLRHQDPVLQLHCNVKDLMVPNIQIGSKESLIKTLMFPLEPELFMSNCFRRKAVHIKSNDNGRASDISTNYMFGLDAKQIFHETSSDSVFLWMKPKKKSQTEDNTNDNVLHSIEITDPDTAYLLHQNSNLASYCRAPPELEQPLVSQMLRDTGLGCGQYDPSDERSTLARGEVETFIGTTHHFTNWHTDFQENFTIQLSGKKKWTLKQGSVKHPLRGTTPHYRSSTDVIENQIKAARLSNPDYDYGMILDSNSFGDEVEIIMEPGDVLYFPAGMWHKVETLEYGVSINISLMGSNFATIFCKALEHELLKREEWREVICNGIGNSDGNPNNIVVEKMDSLISNSLPHVMEHIQQNGFAASIFPPVIRDPPKFQIENLGGEQEDQLNEEILDSSDEGSGIEAIDKNSDDEDSSGPNQNMESSEDVIDIHEFSQSHSMNSHRNRKNVRWRKNLLASLIKMTDVTPIFDENKYILNVNFAGSETHESAVRVVLRDATGLLDTWYSYEKGKIHEKEMESFFVNPPSALVYYGYLVETKTS